MMKNLLCAAALTLSLFAANASAASVNAPARIAVDSGSYGFTTYISRYCVGANRPAWCNVSYRASESATSGKRAGFRQGKFRSR